MEEIEIVDRFDVAYISLQIGGDVGIVPADPIGDWGLKEFGKESLSDLISADEWILDRPDEIVAFIGDGINDGPALTAAHIGISVLSASDLSAQASDILLTTDLSILPRIFEQGRRGRCILRQNLFWAFSYNTVGIAFAAAGLLHPIIAATAMTLSSLFVLFNSLRLGSLKVRLSDLHEQGEATHCE